MWETLRASAPYSWLILVASALGSLASLSAILALHRRPRTALWLGAAATLLTLACATAGAAGAWQLRLDADASATDGELRPAQRLRIRRSGYQLAQLPPRLALFPGALPFLTGAALMFAAARRRAALLAPPPDPDVPFSPRPKLGVPVVFTLAGAISAAVQVGALLDRVPGGHPGAAGTAQRFAADIARLDKAFEHDDILAACERLEDDLDARAASLDPTLVPALPGATRRCVEELIQHALLSQSLHRIGRELEELQRSALVQGDPSLRKLVQSTAAEVEKIPPASDLATD